MTLIYNNLSAYVLTRRDSFKNLNGRVNLDSYSRWLGIDERMLSSYIRRILVP